MQKDIPQKEYDALFRQIGARIRKIRIEKGMVQEDMMDYGFTTRHYQRIETGAPLTIKTAYRICKAFKIKLSDLFADIR